LARLHSVNHTDVNGLKVYDLLDGKGSAIAQGTRVVVRSRRVYLPIVLQSLPHHLILPRRSTGTCCTGE
jgi:hypothetical protein